MKKILAFACISACIVASPTFSYAKPLKHKTHDRYTLHYDVAHALSSHSKHVLLGGRPREARSSQRRLREIALRAHRLHEAQPGRREWSRDGSRVRDASGGILIRASYYSSGRRTADGEVFRPGGFTAANRTLPFGTMLRLTNLSTGRTVTVRVNDRGPFVAGRSLDVSRGAAVALGMIAQGTATLRMERV